MPFKKGHDPNRAPGRTKGALNRLTISAKQTIEDVARDLGGPGRLLAWCQEEPKNEFEFWKAIYPRILPLQLTGDGQAPISVIIQSADKSA